jgi:hypothetical protein
VNDLKIMEYIAATPDARAVQVADKFDVELIDASNALRSLVDVGDLVRTQGTAPNGQAAQVYNLSPEFKKTNDGKAILQRLASAPAAPAAQPAPEKKPSATAPLPTALIDQLSKPGQAEQGRRGAVSRLDRAISFIKTNGKVTNDQLRTLLDMRSIEYPSTVLRPAVHDGRIARDGEDWIIGTGQPPAKQPRSGPTKSEVAPPTPVPAGTPIAPVPTPATVDTSLRCAIWSDGVIELQRDAKTICILKKDEVQFLAAHVNAAGQANAQG